MPSVSKTNAIVFCLLVGFVCLAGGCGKDRPRDPASVRVAAPQTPESASLIDCPLGAVAVVDGRVITAEDADIRAKMNLQMDGRAPDDPGYEALLLKARKGAVDFLIQCYVLQDAVPADMIVSATAVKRELLSWKMQYPSRDHWEQFLEENSMTELEFRNTLEFELKIRQVLADASLEGVPTATPAEVSNYYQVESFKFEWPERVRFDEVAWYILPEISDASREEAYAAMADLFEEMEADPSIFDYIADTVKAASWGYVGIHHPYLNIRELRPEIQEALKTLTVDVISEVIKTEQGYSIVRIKSLREDFESAKEPIYTSIMEERAKINLDNWINRQKKKRRIRICDMDYYYGEDTGENSGTQ